MTRATPTIFVVDDDRAVCTALARLLRAEGFEAAAFDTPEAFLEDHDPSALGCVLLDLSMPGLDGLELQQALAERGSTLPIIFLSGHGDIRSSVRAMKQGAVDFLTKPVNDADLIGAVRVAVDRCERFLNARRQQDKVQHLLDTLTPRERQVLGHIVSGKLNKQVAAELGTVEKTIKVHRARVMMKMGAKSLADLVRIAQGAGIDR